jgi:hypothetical protein
MSEEQVREQIEKGHDVILKWRDGSAIRLTENNIDDMLAAGLLDDFNADQEAQ